MLARLGLLLCALVCLIPAPTLAQTNLPNPIPVALEADDGLTLSGDSYRPAGEGPFPAVLLLHMLNSDRSAWQPLVPALLEQGIYVLAVDLRGHGMTGGAAIGPWPSPIVKPGWPGFWSRAKSAP
ncbi:MAG: hypothetical protein HC915_19140 [Anaerolineae bacterium]|nr:hypothetical protein [Anaerolineae bacterium]